MKFLRQIALDFLARRGFTVIKTARLAAERARLHELRNLALDSGAGPEQSGLPEMDFRVGIDWNNRADNGSALDRLWSERVKSAEFIEHMRSMYREEIISLKTEVVTARETTEILRRIDMHALRNTRLLEAIWARGAANKIYFNLITTGRTATHWIAKALSMHPDIMCVHGTDLSPYQEDKAETARTMRHHEDSKTVTAMNLDEYYDILERRNFLVYGVIHGITAHGALANPGLYRRHYYIAGVTRHPVMRAQSFANRWIFEYRNLITERETMMLQANERIEHVRSWGVILPADADLTLEDRIFISSAVWMFGTEAANDGRFPCFRMEDIVGSREGFVGFFTAVTQGKLLLQETYLDAVMALPRQDSLTAAGSAKEVYASWPRWKQQMFTGLLEFYQIEGCYTDLGYDLSFIHP